MACQVLNETIDGVKYTIVQFPAREGAKLIVRLAKVVGPIFSSIPADVTEISETNVDLSAVIRELGDDSVISLVLDLLRYTKRNGVDINEDSFDTEFSGEYLHLVKVLWFIVRANNFFGKGDIGKVLAQVIKQKTNNQISPDLSMKD